MEERMKEHMYPPRIQEIRELDNEIQRLMHRRVELINMMTEDDRQKYRTLYPPTFEF